MTPKTPYSPLRAGVSYGTGWDVDEVPRRARYFAPNRLTSHQKARPARLCRDPDINILPRWINMSTCSCAI